jgi:hypothetical protein
MHTFFVDFRDSTNKAAIKRLKKELFKALKDKRHPHHDSVQQRIRNVYAKRSKRGQGPYDDDADDDADEEEEEEEEEQEDMDVDGQGNPQDEDGDQPPPPPMPQQTVQV